jgi:molybdopterin synthase sulfur carrier subunit
MPSVLIPTPLRKLTNDLAEVSTAGSNVGELIANLDKAFPGMKDRIYDEAGEVRRFILIHVNGEDIRFLDGLNTAVAERDEVSITPALAGG